MSGEKKRGNDNADVLAAKSIADNGDHASTVPAVEPKRKRGRPEVELTVEIGRVIITAIGAGNFPSTAARIAGVSPGTLTRWLERGGKGEQPFADFYVAFHRAEADCESQVIQKWRNSDDWRAQDRYASSRWPGRWSDHAAKAAVYGTDGLRDIGGLQIQINLVGETPSANSVRQRGLAVKPAIDVTPKPPVRNDPDPSLN